MYDTGVRPVTYDFKISVLDVPGDSDSAIVVVRGPIDAKNSPRFQNTLNSVIQKGALWLAIDMEEVDYMNSTALSCIIVLTDDLHSRGGSIVYSGVQPQVRTVIEVTGLFEYFPSFTTRGEALKEMRRRTSPPARRAPRACYDTLGMSDFEITVQDGAGAENAAVLVVRGPIDSKTAPRFQQTVNSVLDKGVVRMVLDLEQVRYVNSTGLAVMINLVDAVNAQMGSIVFFGVQPKVKVVIDITGLGEYFRIFPTREEAIRAVKGMRGPAPGPKLHPLPVASPSSPQAAPAKSAGGKFEAAALVPLLAVAAYSYLGDPSPGKVLILAAAATLVSLVFLLFARRVRFGGGRELRS